MNTKLPKTPSYSTPRKRVKKKKVKKKKKKRSSFKPRVPSVPPEVTIFVPQDGLVYSFGLEPISFSSVGFISTNQRTQFTRKVRVSQKSQSDFMQEYERDKHPIRNRITLKTEGSIALNTSTSDGSLVVPVGENQWGLSYAASDVESSPYEWSIMPPFGSEGAFDNGSWGSKGIEFWSISSYKTKWISKMIDLNDRITLNGYARMAVATQIIYSDGTGYQEIIPFAVFWRERWGANIVRLLYFPELNIYKDYPNDHTAEMDSDLQKFRTTFLNGIDFTRDLANSVEYTSTYPVNVIGGTVVLNGRFEQFVSTVTSMLQRNVPNLTDIKEGLLLDAVDSSRPDTSNWLETAIGSAALPSSIAALVTRFPKGLVGTITYSAGAFLFWLYGLKPIPSDANNFIRAVEIAKGLHNYPEWSFNSTQEFSKLGWNGVQQGFVRCRGISRDGIDIESVLDNGTPLRAGVIHSPSGQRELTWLNAMSDAGIPTDFWGLISNLWDLLPLSFVFDWFIDIGGWLDRKSLNEYVDRLPILYTRTTMHVFKDESALCQRLAANFGYAASARVSSEYYNRRYGTDIPESEFVFRDTVVENHWVEAGAILCTRLK